MGRLVAAYEAVQAGNAAARDAANAGATPHTVDRAARSVIEDAGVIIDGRGESLTSLPRELAVLG